MSTLLRALLGESAARTVQARRSGRGGGAGTWPGQAAPRPVQRLRPPPEPGGPQYPMQGPETVRAPATAPFEHAPLSTSPEDASPQADRGEDVDEPWRQVETAPGRSWQVRVRDGAVIVAAVVVVTAGVASITRTVVDWVTPSAPAVTAGVITDQQLAGFAEVVGTDFLSWDQGDKPSRQTALARYAAKGAQIDGWDGRGRQVADNATTIGIARGPEGRAVVTVRVRTVPFAVTPNSPPATAPTQQPDAGANVAAAPEVTTQGWTPLQARWVTVAVPVRASGSQLVVTAPPALIGSASELAVRPAVPGYGIGDDVFARDTKAAVARLFSSYATGDLSYARASGTTFTGLNGAAGLGELETWRVARLQPEGDPAHRRGDATVTWQMPGGGSLTSSYLIDLQQTDGRWYLAGISAATERVTS